MTAIERRAAQFGATAIPYAVQRSARRSTVSIAVDPRAGVVLTAPARLAVSRLDDLVRRKAPWILERLRRQSDLPPPLPSKEFVSGESFSYLGRQHRLVVGCGDVEPLCREGGRMRVTLPRDLPEEHAAAYVRAALVDWYAARARAILPPRVERAASRLGVRPARLVVSEPAKRWGSAARDGTLRLSWRIVQAPPSIVEYVVAHETVHLVHRDHGAAFWAELGALLPDYERRKELLRRSGASYVW